MLCAVEKVWGIGGYGIHPSLKIVSMRTITSSFPDFFVSINNFSLPFNEERLIEIQETECAAVLSTHHTDGQERPAAESVLVMSPVNLLRALL
jgi:hypothetical protein